MMAPPTRHSVPSFREANSAHPSFPWYLVVETDVGTPGHDVVWDGVAQEKSRLMTSRSHKRLGISIPLDFFF